jgi:hypothetical protein
MKPSESIAKSALLGLALAAAMALCLRGHPNTTASNSLTFDVTSVRETTASWPPGAV